MKNYATSSILALLLALATACAPDSKSSSVLDSEASNIVGGTTVMPGSPISKQVFMIYMRTAHGGGICTATMLTDTVGLTAAHCLDEVVSGYAIFDISGIAKLEKSKSREDLLKDPRIVPISGVRVHHSWTGSISRGNNGDVAVFKLARAKPRDIEITQIHTDSLNVGQQLVATGYGVNSGSLGFGSGVLRETRVKVLNINVTDTEFAVDQRSAHGVCSGDSGGPSFAVSPFGRLKQVGIVSYGEEGCENSGVYTYVAPYAQWIVSAMRSLK